MRQIPQGETPPFQFWGGGMGPSRSRRSCSDGEGVAGGLGSGWLLMKTVSHLGPLEFRDIGLRAGTGCGSQADAKASPVWEDKTPTNTLI